MNTGILVPPAPAARLLALTGWRRRAATTGLGVLTALALPPVNLVPLLVIAFTGLIWLMDAAPGRRAAFAVGWWFGFGFFSAGLYWIANALLVEPLRFGWMIPFATFGLGGFLALFTAATTLAVKAARVAGPGRVLLLAALWIVLEWVRAWILTGFPWNLMASVWSSFDGMLQSTAWIGSYGLGLVTLSAAAMPAILSDPMAPRRRAAWILGALAVPAMLWVAGEARLSGAGRDAVPGVKLRLVQGNVNQMHKWQETLRAEHFETHIRLSKGPGFDSVTHVIWPETASPYFLDLDSRRRGWAAEAAPPGGLVIIGAPRITPLGIEPFRAWNSMLAIDSGGRVVSVFDKFHLVPFGEYVPLRGILPVEIFAQGQGDFTAGPGPATLVLPGLPPVSPLICYEVIFPGEVVAPGQTRPQWLLNLTNDAWFGYSAGPYQHLAAARLRAVEEGLPLVRADNSGISAVIDGYGRVWGRLELGVQGVLDSGLPRALETTLYAYTGNTLPLGLAGATIVVALVLGRRATRR